MTAAGFKKKIAETVSASITAGISLKEEADFIFDKTSVTVNLSGTIEEQSSIEKEYIIPPEQVKVPPHKQIIATDYWSQIKMKQNVKISCDISAKVSGKCYVHSTIPGQEHVTRIWNETYNLGELIAPSFQGYHTYFPGCPENITFNSDWKTIHFVGALDCYGVDAGSFYQVKFGSPTPIDNINN